MSRPIRSRRHMRILAPLALAACGTLLAPLSAGARTLEEAFAEGERAYAAANLDDARKAYAEALQAAPSDVPTLCRLSKVESELGETQKGDVQRRTWADAVVHAREAVRLAPEPSEAHIPLAVALGRQALHEGARTRLALSKEIKAETDLALQKDPDNGRAWHVLALWNV